MTDYFRTYGNIQNSLIVLVSINKKYTFGHYGKVVSKAFGELQLTNHERVKDSKGNNSFLFAKSLGEIDLLERKQQILNDTISVKMGDVEYLFATKKTD